MQKTKNHSISLDAWQRGPWSRLWSSYQFLALLTCSLIHSHYCGLQFYYNLALQQCTALPHTSSTTSCTEIELNILPGDLKITLDFMPVLQHQSICWYSSPFVSECKRCVFRVFLKCQCFVYHMCGCLTCKMSLLVPLVIRTYPEVEAKLLPPIWICQERLLLLSSPRDFGVIPPVQKGR